MSKPKVIPVVKKRELVSDDYTLTAKDLEYVNKVKKNLMARMNAERERQANITANI